MKFLLLSLSVTLTISSFAQKTKGRYENGKKEGPWLIYYENGKLRDSTFYVNGHPKGTTFAWYESGKLSDSSHFDGNGHGSGKNWDEDGALKYVWSVERDSVPSGKWQQFRKDGSLLADINFVNGKKIGCECYDKTGKKLDATLCNKEEEASFPGGAAGWKKFLMKNLDPNVPAKLRAKAGVYTVILTFRVDGEGNVLGIKATTDFGHGMEEEAIRVLQQSPKWIPAMQYGETVTVYRQQPITFVITK